MGDGEDLNLVERSPERTIPTISTVTALAAGLPAGLRAVPWIAALAGLRKGQGRTDGRYGSLLDRAWLQSDVEPSCADRAVPLRPDDLPDYERPPLVEVALAVQYQALPLRQAHLGLFWSRMIKDYPATQDLPPLEPSPGPWVGDGDPMITLELTSAPRVNRSWFIGHEDTRLIQVQADRFVANWRSRTSDRDYPRFEPILTEFSRSLQVYDETSMTTECHDG